MGTSHSQVSSVTGEQSVGTVRKNSAINIVLQSVVAYLEYPSLNRCFLFFLPSSIAINIVKISDL